MREFIALDGGMRSTANVDLILHAGGVCLVDTLEEPAAYAPATSRACRRRVCGVAAGGDGAGAGR